MSTFAVSIEKIARTWEHTNADLLEMAQLESMTYQFVIPKGQYQAGDLVVYFPIDSLLPVEVIEKLGLAGKLAGKDKNRIKTVRLRGEISQGVVAFPRLVLPEDTDFAAFTIGQDIAEILGVTKYEPPLVPSHAGNLVRLPELVGVYDIEGAERFAEIVETYLLDKPVIITEKLEGSHFAASLLADDTLAISQRHYRIEPVPGKLHDWHKVAQTSGIQAALPHLKTALTQYINAPIQTVTVRGEVLGPGIQKNIYQLADHKVVAFEIEVNGTPIEAGLFLILTEQFNIEHVPVLAQHITLREWLAGRSLAAASNGKSRLNPDTLREGIVIRPMTEIYVNLSERVILKQRSPEYLSSSDF